MAFSTNINNVVTRIATEFKLIKTYISGSGTGDVTALATASDNLVGAINELHTEVDAITASVGNGDMLAATYDPQNIASDVFDRANHTGTQTVSTISDFTAQVNALAQAIVDNVIDAAPGTLDTLNELAAALGDDPNFATTINTSLANRLRFDVTQTLNATQLQQGQDNLQVYSRTELGDPDTNYVTTFETGLI